MAMGTKRPWGRYQNLAELVECPSKVLELQDQITSVDSFFVFSLSHPVSQNWYVKSYGCAIICREMHIEVPFLFIKY